MSFNYIILYTTEENSVYIILLVSYKFLASLSMTEIFSGSCVENLGCHAPIPGPTRLADPNWFPGHETKYWDSLPDFFF